MRSCGPSDQTLLQAQLRMQRHFQNAIMNARQLPPDLLTNSQKLRLYALYKQTVQTAPEDPPPRVNPLARAKVCMGHTHRSCCTPQRACTDSGCPRALPSRSGRHGTTCTA